jgi:hypothetical protein
MAVRIAGKRMYLWRVIDEEGEGNADLATTDTRAALRLMRKLLKRQASCRNRCSPTNYAPTPRRGRGIRRMIPLLSFVEELRQRGCDFRILNGSFPIDTTTASGRLLFDISAALAENERDVIRERTIAGLASARDRGRKGAGRQS